MQATKLQTIKRLDLKLQQLPKRRVHTSSAGFPLLKYPALGVKRASAPVLSGCDAQAAQAHYKLAGGSNCLWRGIAGGCVAAALRVVRHLSPSHSRAIPFIAMRQIHFLKRPATHNNCRRFN